MNTQSIIAICLLVCFLATSATCMSCYSYTTPDAVATQNQTSFINCFRMTYNSKTSYGGTDQTCATIESQAKQLSASLEKCCSTDLCNNAGVLGGVMVAIVSLIASLFML